MEVIYLKHPVSKAEKQKANSEGKRIIDIKFAPKEYAPAPKRKKAKGVKRDTDNSAD